MKRKKALGITCKRATPQRVGSFFEDLTRRVLSGFQAHNENGGDLINWSAEMGVEVKATDNNHHLRIKLNQLDGYLDEVFASFLVKGFMYALWTYRNAAVLYKGGAKHTPLSRLSGEDRIRAFLANHADTLYLFDIQVIQAIRERWVRPSFTLPTDRTAPVIELKRREVLNEFSNGHTAETLRDLGLERYGFICENRTITVPLQDFFIPTIDVRMVSVLTIKQHELLFPQSVGI